VSKKEGVEPTAAAIHIRSVFTVLQDTVTPGMNQAIKSADELYRFWHNFENLPRFMKHLKNVEVYDEKSRTGLLMHLGVKVWNGMRIS
jgi:uncharacterized membrane protein